ncbi:MAG: sulfite exporter TauE/SafE family protein [Methanobacteriaceae archaeon]|nr:sulfite exporter TauE/SafE family protein [Methanobacteriaceae archaeon]
MDILLYILILLLAGAITGFLSGLLGVGGGFIMTPIQYFLLVHIGVEANLAITISFATSLGIILITSIFSSRKHYANNFVVKKNIKFLIVSGFFGALSGALLSVHLDVNILQLIFAILCIGAGIWMFIIKYPENSELIASEKYKYILLGLCAGLLSGLLGVGGGIILIPIFCLVLKYPVHKAIGTSSTIIIFTSCGGLLMYLILGLYTSNLPDYCFGYINILQLIFISLTSCIFAKYGADTAKKTKPIILKYLHIILMLFIGLKMGGLF